MSSERISAAGGEAGGANVSSWSSSGRVVYLKLGAVSEALFPLLKSVTGKNTTMTVGSLDSR
jgi:hypothetical protein